MDKQGLNSQQYDFAVDGHVHVYPSMSVEAVLEAARGNLPELDSQASVVGVLLVADPDGVDGYLRLRSHERSSRVTPSNWVQEDHDELAVVLRRTSGERVVALRGQQLITSEGLEVLSTGCAVPVASGATLARTLDSIRTAGGASIVAWGVGKWLGRRGRIVTEMIHAEQGRADIMLADNGGRPRLWSYVPQFELARERGMRIIAGTDPLPLAGEEGRVGSYGFRVRSIGAPGRTIADAFRAAFEDFETPVELFGQRAAVGRFVCNQLRLRLRSGLR